MPPGLFRLLIQPTFQELGALGAIVLIRIVISYSLTSELRSETKAVAK